MQLVSLTWRDVIKLESHPILGGMYYTYTSSCVCKGDTKGDISTWSLAGGGIHGTYYFYETFLTG